MSISIKEISFQEYDKMHYGRLVLDFKNVSTAYINTLRRIMLEEVCSYAFSSESIKIEENSSIFHNDIMRLHISQLPI